MEMDKRDIFDNVEDKAKHLVKAEPYPFLYDKILNKIQTGNYEVSTVLNGNPFIRWGLAMIISILIISSFYTTIRINKFSSQPIADESLQIKEISTETGYYY